MTLCSAVAGDASHCLGTSQPYCAFRQSDVCYLSVGPRSHAFAYASSSNYHYWSSRFLMQRRYFRCLPLNLLSTVLLRAMRQASMRKACLNQAVAFRPSSRFAGAKTFNSSCS